MGGPTSSICYRQHSSQDHVTTQAPPLRQSRDTFGRLRDDYYYLNNNTCSNWRPSASHLLNAFRNSELVTPEMFGVTRRIYSLISACADFLDKLGLSLVSFVSTLVSWYTLRPALTPYDNICFPVHRLANCISIRTLSV